MFFPEREGERLEGEVACRFQKVVCYIAVTIADVHDCAQIQYVGALINVTRCILTAWRNSITPPVSYALTLSMRFCQTVALTEWLIVRKLQHLLS